MVASRAVWDVLSVVLRQFCMKRLNVYTPLLRTDELGNSVVDSIAKCQFCWMSGMPLYELLFWVLSSLIACVPARLPANHARIFHANVVRCLVAPWDGFNLSQIIETSTLFSRTIQVVQSYWLQLQAVHLAAIDDGRWE